MKRASYLLGIGIALGSAPASAQLPFNPSQFAAIQALTAGDNPNKIIQSIGIVLDHRPYQPATPLGSSVGVDISIEASLVKIPTALKEALAAAGNSGTLPPFLPVAKVHLHKGLGENAEIGLSGFIFQDFYILGGDFKHVIFRPDQGLVWSFRAKFNYAKVSFVRTRTFTPELLVSRKMDFADPYLGVGVPYSWGTIIIPAGNTAIEATGKKLTFQSFLGVLFKFGATGLTLSLEGGYSLGEAHYMGTKIGLRF